MSQKIKKKFIGADQVGSNEILIEKDAALRGTLQDDSVVDLLSLNVSDEVFIKGIKILNSSDLIPSAILPSYVDDILEYANFAAFPVTGESGKIYIALDTNKQYRWSGSAYVQITSGAVDSVNGETGIVVLDASEIQMVSEPVSIESKLVSLQGELDDTQSGAGLETDGSYAAPVGSAYLDAASSLKDADSKLDAGLAQEVLDREGADDILQNNIDAVADDVANLVTLSGVAVDSVNLGSFTGSTIADSRTVKAALQDLETAHEAHLNDTVDAHDASAISLSPAINGQSDVQSALGDHESRIDALEVGGGDTKQIKISATDTTEGYAFDKIVGASAKITTSIINSGANEELQIDIGGDVFDKSVDSTDDISEGSINLFFTETRAKSAAVSDSITDGVTDVAPSQNAVFDALALKFDSANFSSEFDSNLATKNTDNLAEGLSNLYFTESRARSAVVDDFITDGVTDKAPSQNAVHDALAGISGDLSDHINQITDAHDASAISFVASGNIAATDVQAAIQELDTEKVKKSGDTMSGLLDITVAGNVAIEANNIIIGEPWGAGYSVISPKDGSTDEMYVQSADQMGPFAGNPSKQAVFASGFTSGANSGAVQVLTGDAVGAGASSGSISVKSGPSAQADTGYAELKSGNAAAGNSGIVAVGSGDATSGTAGALYLFSGQGSAGRGMVQIEASKLNMLNAIDMNAHQINELANGTVSTDAVNKGQLDNGLALKLDLAGGTMSGDINMQNHKILHLTMNTDPDCAATKQYVDNVAEGLHVHAPVRLIRNAAIVGTYDNGVDGVGATITPTSAVVLIDGIGSFAVNQRIILNGQSNSWENGVYIVTAVDGSNHITELTRATDFDTPTEVAGGDFIFVQEGDTYANTGWVETKTTTALGFGVSDPIQFLQFSGAGSYSAGDGLNLLGTVFSVDATDLVGFGIGHDGSNNFRISSQAAGDGITGGDGAALSVNHDGEGLDFIGGQLVLELDGATLEKSASGLKLSDTTVTAGSYGDASSTVTFDVDAQGRLTSANEQSISITASQVSDFESAVQGYVSVSDTNSIDMSYSAGVFSADLRLDPANSALVVGASGLKLDNTAVVASSYGSASKSISFNVDAQGRLTSASEQDIDILSSQVSDFDSHAKGLLSVSDTSTIDMSYNSTSGEFSAAVKNNSIDENMVTASVAGAGLSGGNGSALAVNAGDGIQLISDAVAVKASDIVGNGLQESSNNLAIKPEFSATPDISVSSSGLSIVNRFEKKNYTIVASDSVLTNNYYDLLVEIEPYSLVAFVDRLAIHEGASFDYTVSTVSGKSRITFLNSLVTAGQQKLAAGDQLFFTYQKKAK